MRIMLINPPYVTITSRFGSGHQIPLGLLMVGGPLRDAGHQVRLLDAERGHLSYEQITDEVVAWRPEVVMTGHAGSTPAHPVCMAMLRAIKRAAPEVLTVYGGVFPTYHADRILQEEPAVDFIVRGEGEETTLALINHLATAPYDGGALRQLAGISYLVGEEVVSTLPRPPIRNLDRYRIGWELIEDWDRYTCFGLGRAAIVQFSRGCPHRCTYCGQHGFWVRWRYRDVTRFVDEVEWLYHTHDIRFFTLADENPTTSPTLWEALLSELAARDLPVHFFATIRATDIVRDEAILPLYRRAGLLYILMGIESTNPNVLREVQKGSTTREDYRACRLLKAHGIYSIMGHIVGLEDDSWAGFRQALQQLRLYDGDYLNAMYVTPHTWTKFAREVAGRGVIQPDQQRWDYRHQVLAQPHLKPWQLFAAVKWLELCFHLHPRKLKQFLAAPNPFHRRLRLWTLWHTGFVWLAEIVDFLFRSTFVADPRPLADEIERATVPADGVRLTKRAA